MVFNSHGEQMSSYPNFVKQAYSYAEHGKSAEKEFKSKTL
jgi:hypothetical protein